MVLPIILSGGVGSRLWPLSREVHPKPFIKLGDGQSLLQKSYSRACDISDIDEIVTVTNRDLFFYSKDEFEEIGISTSRAQCLAVVVANPKLLEIPCGTVEQMKLVNTFCWLDEYAESGKRN